MSVFKISPNDPDLEMFEKCITNFHPEFYVLKQNGKPSYEHPDFCEKTLGFDYLPGCKDDYDVLAMSLLNKDDIRFYVHENLVLLGRPIAQLVKTKKQEDMLTSSFENNLSNLSVKYKGELYTFEELLDSCVKDILLLWNLIIPNYLESIRDNKNFFLHKKDIDKIKSWCKDISDVLYEISSDKVFNEKIREELSHKQKFSLLSKILFFRYQTLKEDYICPLINKMVNLTPKNYRHLFTDIKIKEYVDVILSYEISKYSERIDKEHSGINMARKIELQSPSTFLYMRFRKGGKADDIRKSYRWFFIKAWLYSYLKNKELSASKAAEVILDDDKFFYEEKLTTVDDADTDIYGSRKKTLTNEFSHWNKHPQTKGGYLANKFKDKCYREYWE